MTSPVFMRVLQMISYYPRGDTAVMRFRLKLLDLTDSILEAHEGALVIAKHSESLEQHKENRFKHTSDRTHAGQLRSTAG